MAIDKELQDAVKEAVKNQKQPAKVAEQINKWLQEMSVSEVTADDRAQRLELIRDLVKTKGG